MSKNPTEPTSIALHIPNYYDGSHSAPNESFLFSLHDDQENYSTCIPSEASHAQYSNQQNPEYQEHSYYSGTFVPGSSQPSPNHILSDIHANYDSYLNPNCHNYSDFSRPPAHYGGQYNRAGQEYPHCSRGFVHYSNQPNPDIQDSISLIDHASNNVHRSPDKDFLGQQLSYKRTTRSCPNSAQISPIPSPPQRKTSTASFTCDEQNISIGSPDDSSVTKYKITKEMSENPTKPTSIALHIPNYYDGSHSAPNESFLFSLHDDQENYSTCIPSGASHAQYSNQQNPEYQEHSYYSGTFVPGSGRPSPNHILSDIHANYDSYLNPNCHNYSDFSRHPAHYGGQYNRAGQEYPHCSRGFVHYSTQPNPDIQDSISLIDHASNNVHRSPDKDFLGQQLSYKRTTRLCPNSAQISPIPSPPQRKTSTASFTCDEQRRNYTQEERRLKKKRQNLESQRRFRDKQRKEWELLKQENDKFRQELNIQTLEIAEKNEQIKRLEQQIESMRLTVDIPLDEIVPTLMNF